LRDAVDALELAGTVSTNLAQPVDSERYLSATWSTLVPPTRIERTTRGLGKRFRNPTPLTVTQAKSSEGLAKCRPLAGGCNGAE
jgi:hypothetical protein